MRFITVALSVAALVQHVSGEVFTIMTRKEKLMNDSRNAMWHTNIAVYPWDANDGCRDPGIHYVSRVCMDWTRKRAHYITKTGERRCMREWNSHDMGYCLGTAQMGFYKCSVQRWHDAVCDW